MDKLKDARVRAEDEVRCSSVSDLHELEICLRIRCFAFELNRSKREEQDLNGRSCTVLHTDQLGNVLLVVDRTDPERSRYAIAVTIARRCE